MESSDQFREAAIALGAELRDIPPVTGVGVGARYGTPIFIVYLGRRLSGPEAGRIPREWHSYPVQVSLFGKIIPAGKSTETLKK
jgi:hypothetical protein